MVSVPELPTETSTARVLLPPSDGDAAKPAREPALWGFVSPWSDQRLYQWRQ